jgi:O-antigen/teichoic acid export membrane protein
MSTVSRTNAVIKNLFIGIAGQLFNLILGFVSRTVFIKQLGVVFLGVSGLFGNIFSLLSLVELGIGSAIIFSLYKPLAEKDEAKIKVLMNFYAKTYKIIGVVIFLLGLSLIPFLKFLIKDQPNIVHLKLIFFLYLFDTFISYFFSYKRSLFYADQKNYINVINTNVYLSISKIIQIVVLIFTQNFIIFLLVQILFTFLSNLDISIRVNKSYPFLKNKTRDNLSTEDYKSIKKNIFSLFLLKIGGVVINGTDNILISSFIGITLVGVYSNYLMLIGIIQTLISQIFTPMTASIGNLINSESKERSLEVFYRVYFINFIIYGFSCICLFILLTPFIHLWLGQEFIFTTSVVFILLLNVYLLGIRNVLWVYINSIGLFYHFRYMPFIEISLKLVLSIILLHKLGIAGIFLGTLISTVITYFITEPYILFKQYFKLPIKKYFVRYFIYISTFFITGTFVWYVTSFINDNNWTGFFIKALVTFTITGFSFLLFFYKTKEFKYLLTLSLSLFKRRRTVSTHSV